MIDALPLLRALRSKEEPQRVRAALTMNAELAGLSGYRREERAARMRTDRRIAAALVNALADDSAAVRRAAGWALTAGKTAHRGGLSPGGVQRLLDCLRDERSDTRRWAVLVFGQMREPVAEPALRRMRRHDSNAAVRTAARQALALMRSGWVRRRANPKDQLGHQSIVSCLALSPDGRTLYSGGWDGTVRTWDLPSGRSTWIFSREGHTNRNRCGRASDSVDGLALSEDGRILAVAMGFDDVTLLDVRTGKILKRVDAGRDEVVFCSRSLNRSGGAADAVRFVDRKGKTIRRLRATSIHDAACSADGAVIGVRSSEWTIMNVKSGKPVSTLPRGIDQLAFSPDGTKLATTAYGRADLRDVRRANVELQTFALSNDVARAIVRGAPAFSPDGALVTFGQGVWETATGTPKWIDVDPAWIRATIFSKDGRQVAFAGDRHAIIWKRATTGEPVAVLGRPRNEVVAVAVGSDGRSLAASYEDGKIRRWDLVRGCVVSELAPAAGTARANALTSDGLLLSSDELHSPEWRLVAKLEGGKVRLLSQSDPGAPARDLALPAPDGASAWICAIACSPQGDLLATGADGFYLALWDTSTWEIRRFINLTGDGVRSLAFSPDGRTLAVATSYANEVELRDVETGGRLGVL